jgi:hypothetical protein
MIPRNEIFPVFFVMAWTYLNYYEPLFLPIGLFILVGYSEISKRSNEKESREVKHRVVG